MSQRREFLKGTLAAVGSLTLGTGLGVSKARAAVPPSGKSQRILILGGTGYIGPHFVQAARDRGHQVAVFNRGKGQADLPVEVERLIGDRNGDLKSIQHRDWDAVLDLPTLVPSWVRTFGEALKGRVGHYTFISTVAAYERPSEGHLELTERSPLRTYRGSADPYKAKAPQGLEEYGSFKVLCESEAEKHFPGRSLILRPGYIAGPGEAQGQFAYWTLRLEQGGETLVAGDASTPVQFIDVRDLALWGIRAIEQHTTGIYNATGPAIPNTLSRFIEAARGAAVAPLTWVSPKWLAKQKDSALWSKLLYWSLEADGWGWAMQMNIDRALAAGLTLRPSSVTQADVVNWFRQLPAEEQATLLPMPWTGYLQREKEVLATWHAERRRVEQGS